MTYAKPNKMTAIKPLTEEEKREQVLRQLAQKKEMFSQGVLFNLCRNSAFVLEDADPKAVAAFAAATADALIEELFIPKAPVQKK